MFTKLLAKLIDSPSAFSSDDMRAALSHILDAENVTDTQIGSFLTALNTLRVDRRPDLLANASKYLFTRSIPWPVPAKPSDFIIDTGGTGGDRFDTYNVSTTASVVAAGAGARCYKHGNNGSTSSSGSADIMQALECRFPTPEQIARSALPIPPFFFVYARHYHPAFGVISRHRKELPMRSIFNMMGPLLNPVHPHGKLVGVPDLTLGRPLIESLRLIGIRRAIVVSGAEGIDEISCEGDTFAWQLHEDGSITESTLHPRMFGLPVHSLHAVSGSSAYDNARTFKALLTSGRDIPASLVPVMDFVLLNASALLIVAGIANDYKHGVQLARESICSGAAWKAFQSFKAYCDAAYRPQEKIVSPL